MTTLNTFIHEGKTYLRVNPAKYMMRSTMIYDVIMRGDIFAVNLENGEVGIFKGDTQVEEQSMILVPSVEQIVQELKSDPDRPKRTRKKASPNQAELPLNKPEWDRGDF